MRPAATVLALLAIVSGVAACGSSAPTGGQLRAEGRAIFARDGCAGCHTLRAASSHGTLGPDFDTSEKLTRPEIVQQLNGGTGGMPSFRDRLSERQKRAVAEFLYSATHR